MQQRIPPSQFLNRLKVEHLEGKWWRLLRKFSFYSNTLNKTITVPKGFVTDFASVPRLPLVYLITGNTSHWEAVGHDLDYRWGLLTRKQADDRFYEMSVVRSQMRKNQRKVYNIGRTFRGRIMKLAVRSFGWLSYNQKPGCLDWRYCDSNSNCNNCKCYYSNWKNCYKDGFIV